MAGLRIENVEKVFGNKKVIDKVSINVEQGEFCIFVGPSGCGKSTLLRMVAGLEDLDSGKIFIDDQEVNDREASERGIAMVFQSYALYPHMSVAENMGFGLRMTGTAKPDIQKRVNEAANILQIQDLLQRKPAQLSGGQRQRVAIGRAIVRKPKVFLFDEPLSNLDAELRIAMRVEISRLHQKLPEATMIYVTHDQVEAMTMADKIVALRDGKVEQIGAPLDLYDNPKNKFVAGFIGSPRMNFINATCLNIDTEQKRIELELPDFAHQSSKPTIKLDLQKNPENLDAQAKLLLGIRPEHFSIRSAPIKLPTTVDVVEHLGASSFLHVRPKNSASNFSIVLETRNRLQAKPGDAIEACFKHQHAYLFQQNGSRLA